MNATLRTEDYYITPEEYLASERISQTKHEYLAGVVYAMAGASRGHNRIVGNIARELSSQLRGKPCEAFSSDMRLTIQNGSTEFYYYPDVVVDCSGSTRNMVEEPTVVVEVLSPDTERVDRGEKLNNYQNLPSLKAYVLVDQFHAAVTVYRREGDNWCMDFFGEKNAVIELPSIGCALPLSAIYERMHF